MIPFGRMLSNVASLFPDAFWSMEERPMKHTTAVDRPGKPRVSPPCSTA